MNKGAAFKMAVAILPILFSVAVRADIYKLVDEHGNVTYTDQAPADGSQPIKLPELSVVDSGEQPPVVNSDESEEVPGDSEPVASAPTPRELRRMYRDFRITRPAQEETFWGTANQVVVSWSAGLPLQPGMTVRVMIDGQHFADTEQGMLALTLDRGEHQVLAELHDSRGRRVASSAAVKFFVKQSSVNFNQRQPDSTSKN